MVNIAVQKGEGDERNDCRSVLGRGQQIHAEHRTEDCTQKRDGQWSVGEDAGRSLQLPQGLHRSNS